MSASASVWQSVGSLHAPRCSNKARQPRLDLQGGAGRPRGHQRRVPAAAGGPRPLRVARKDRDVQGVTVYLEGVLRRLRRHPSGDRPGRAAPRRRVGVVFIVQSYEGLADEHQAARLLGSSAALIVHRMPSPSASWLRRATSRRPGWLADPHRPSTQDQAMTDDEILRQLGQAVPAMTTCWPPRRWLRSAGSSIRSGTGRSWPRCCRPSASWPGWSGGRSCWRAPSSPWRAFCPVSP